MFNNMMQVLSDVPPTLAAAWAVWFGAGVLLTMWYRKANAEVPYAVAPRTVARAKEPRPVAAEPRPVAVARPKPSSIVVGDPFGDLATLLDQPAESAPAAPSHRVPGDSPILNSAGSPVLRTNNNEPGY